MSCAPGGVELAYTGAPIAALVAAGAVCVGLGVVLVVAARGRRRGAGGAMLALLLAGGLFAVVGPGPSARAAAQPYPPSGAHPSLIIVQTSTNDGMAPGVAPGLITGTITNRGTAATFVTAVTVRITAVA